MVTRRIAAASTGVRSSPIKVKSPFASRFNLARRSGESGCQAAAQRSRPPRTVHVNRGEAAEPCPLHLRHRRQRPPQDGLATEEAKDYTAHTSLTDTAESRFDFRPFLPPGFSHVSLVDAGTLGRATQGADGRNANICWAISIFYGRRKTVMNAMLAEGASVRMAFAYVLGCTETAENMACSLAFSLYRSAAIRHSSSLSMGKQMGINDASGTSQTFSSGSQPNPIAWLSR